MMTTRHLVDPEIAPVIDNFVVDLSAETLDAVRAGMVEQIQETIAPLKEDSAVAIGELTIPGEAGQLRLLTVRPVGASGKLPAIFHIHGGGMVVGIPEMSLGKLTSLARDLQCVVVSVDYRLAPETPHPGPLNDCYTALSWLFNNADTLSVDANRIAIMGESAGGGLTAALALYTRDKGEFKPVFQQLSCPMLDDRTSVRPNPYPQTGEFIWTRESNLFGWQSLLGCEPGSEGISHYASPARAEDLSNLPPAMIYIGGLDLFLHESLDYAQRLMAAGVPTAIHVYPGAIHGFEMMTDSALAQACYRDVVNALGRVFA